MPKKSQSARKAPQSQKVSASSKNSLEKNLWYRFLKVIFVFVICVYALSMLVVAGLYARETRMVSNMPTPYNDTPIMQNEIDQNRAGRGFREDGAMMRYAPDDSSNFIGYVTVFNWYKFLKFTLLAGAVGGAIFWLTAKAFFYIALEEE